MAAMQEQMDKVRSKRGTKQRMHKSHVAQIDPVGIGKNTMQNKLQFAGDFCSKRRTRCSLSVAPREQQSASHIEVESLLPGLACDFHQVGAARLSHFFSESNRSFLAQRSAECYKQSALCLCLWQDLSASRIICNKTDRSTRKSNEEEQRAWLTMSLYLPLSCELPFEACCAIAFVKHISRVVSSHCSCKSRLSTCRSSSVSGFESLALPTMSVRSMCYTTLGA